MTARAGDRFANPVATDVMLRDHGGVIWRFLFERGEREPARPLPVQPLSVASLVAPPLDDVRVTWFGHSSVWLDVEGSSVLCDPVWSERSSPVSFAGPRRFHPPAIPLDQLPLPDVVLISHDHFDHLDETTIRTLASRGARFVVPLGVGRWLAAWGVAADHVDELDWWQQRVIAPGRLTVVATPARHFSGRGLFGRNRTLWTSYALLGPTRRVYFGGDSGLFDGLREIGEKFGPFDLDLLEIGAYDPAWGDIHLGPVGAVTAHQMLGGKVLLPIHWGTFNLGLHAWYAPPEELLVAATEKNVQLALPRIGASFALAGEIPRELWWRAVLK